MDHWGTVYIPAELQDGVERKTKKLSPIEIAAFVLTDHDVAALLPCLEPAAQRRALCREPALNPA